LKAALISIKIKTGKGSALVLTIRVPKVIPASACFPTDRSDGKSGRGNGLAAADKTLSRWGQTIPFFEDKAAVAAHGWDMHEFPLQRLGSGDMSQVFINLFLTDAHGLGDFLGRHFPVFQYKSNGLAYGSHGFWVVSPL
jgi:hypothetical protein